MGRHVDGEQGRSRVGFWVTVAAVVALFAGIVLAAHLSIPH